MMRKPLHAAGVSCLFTTALLFAATLASAESFPRTPSGKPDFSGNYDIASLTPFERDPNLGDQLVITIEEARQIERGADELTAARDASIDPDRSAPAVGGNVGFYNFFWFDAGMRRFQIDGEYRTSILTDPPNGRMPPVSEAGKARRAAVERPRDYKNTGTAWWLEEGGDPYDNPESLQLIDRCIYGGIATVPIRPVVYNNLKTIVQTDSHVVIHIEWMHWPRIVRLDSEHAPPDVRSLAGDSIGWWEGDTLVVETTNFLAVPNVPREGLKVVERFSPIDDGSILYQFAVDDPDYEAPYGGEFPWPKTTAYNYEYACHEGNYAMGNILRGARLLEEELRQRQGDG